MRKCDEGNGSWEMYTQTELTIVPYVHPESWGGGLLLLFYIIEDRER